MLRQFKLLLVILLPFFQPGQLSSQIDQDQLGAWYMYFWNTEFSESKWGLQGDIQHRNWDLLGDLEQLLLRGGLTYQPGNSPAKFTLGYAHISTGAFGDDKSIVTESRIYQEALIPQHLGGRFYLTHRFRFEQRFVESQDFRTRWRYNIFLNVLLNQSQMSAGAWYLAFYNELFINGQRDIGDGRSVELFDRNRAYAALGHALANGLRIQLGIMEQTTDNWKKKQLQLSLHHSF